MLRKLFAGVRSFHRDEDGGESAVSTILILAIGALVMIGLHQIWDSIIKPMTEGHLGDMFSLDFTQ